MSVIASQKIGRVCVVHKGNWSATTQYEKLDIVFHNGSSYLAIKDNKNKEPNYNSTNWALLSGTGAGSPEIIDGNILSWGDTEAISDRVETLENDSWRLKCNTLIEANADLDDYVTIGNYLCTPASRVSTITNKPDQLNTSFAFVMHVWQTADKYGDILYLCQQIENLGNEEWRRYRFSDEGWGPWHLWHRTLSETALYLRPFNFIQAYDNLNTYITPGSYGSTGGSVTKTLVNLPLEVNDFGFRLYVNNMTPGSSSYISQNLISERKGGIFTRYTENAGVSWSNWQQTPTRSEINTVKNRIVFLGALSNGAERSLSLSEWTNYQLIITRYKSDGGIKDCWKKYIITCFGKLDGTEGPTITISEESKGSDANTVYGSFSLDDAFTIASSGNTLVMSIASGVYTMCTLVKG